VTAQHVRAGGDGHDSHNLGYLLVDSRQSDVVGCAFASVVLCVVFATQIEQPPAARSASAEVGLLHELRNRLAQRPMTAFTPVTIVQLGRLSGVTEDVIRGYLEIGLMPQPRRRPGMPGRVAYHREHLDRLRFIDRALALGFSLDAIGELLGLDGGSQTCGEVYRLTQRTLAAVRSLNVEPSSTLKELAAACPRRGGRADCPILCELSRPDV